MRQVATSWDKEAWPAPEPFVEGHRVGPKLTFMEAKTDRTVALIWATCRYLVEEKRFIEENQPWGCRFQWEVSNIELSPTDRNNDQFVTLRRIKMGTCDTPMLASWAAIDCAALNERCSEEAWIRRVKEFRAMQALSRIGT